MIIDDSNIPSITLITIGLYAIVIGVVAYFGVWAWLERGENKATDKAKMNNNFWTDGGRHGRPEHSWDAGSIRTHDGSRYVPSHGSPAFRP